MKKKINIVFFSANRAEYSLISPFLKILNQSNPKINRIKVFYSANKAAKPIPSTKAAAMSITV